jgi:hypothetical protein
MPSQHSRLANFHAQAKRRLRAMKKTGMAISAEEVFAYLEARARCESPARPKPRKIGGLNPIVNDD